MNTPPRRLSVLLGSVLGCLGTPSLLPAATSASIPASASVTRPLVIDNFNSGVEVNIWGGANGVVPDGSLTRTYVTDIARSGYGLRLTYDMSLAGLGWNAFYMKLGFALPSGDVTPTDLTPYGQLVFWARGAAGGEQLKIQLTNNSSNAGRRSAFVYVNDYLDGGLTTTFQEVRIPLEAFANLDSLTNVVELTFAFETAYASANGLPMTGTVYIDDVSVDPAHRSFLRVDHFGDAWGWSALGGNMGDMAGGSATATHSYSSIASQYHLTPKGLVSNYNVSAFGSWAGHFQVLGGDANGWTAVPMDVSRFRWFRLWARAANNASNPEKIKIEIQSNGKTAPLQINFLSTTWSSFTFDLNAIAPALLDKTTVKQINIIYENSNAVDKVGTVYFDEIEFFE